MPQGIVPNPSFYFNRHSSVVQSPEDFRPMTRRLLGDGGSPLYYRRSPLTLRHAVHSARLALEPVSAPAEVEVPLAA